VLIAIVVLVNAVAQIVKTTAMKRHG
jgi:hypothetical protein